MRTLIVATLVVLAGCRPDEPLEQSAGTCGVTHAWRSAIDLGPMYSILGASVADDGHRVVAVWDQLARDLSSPDQTPVFAILDRDSGDVVVPAQPLPGPKDLWRLQVVATKSGFLAFTFHGEDGVDVQHIDDDGTLAPPVTLAALGNNPDDPIVADDDGATFISYGMIVTRINADGSVASSSTVDGADFCTGATETAGRVVAWCIRWNDDESEWAQAVLIDMNRDGSDATVSALDVATFPPLAGVLALSGDHVIAAFEDHTVVHAAAFAFDATVAAAPVEIDRAAEGADTQVSVGDGNSAFTATSTGDGAFVGTDIYSDAVRVVDLVAVSFKDGAIVAAPRDTLAPAHTHGTTASPDGPIVTWIESGTSWWPPEPDPQHVVVERRCP